MADIARIGLAQVDGVRLARLLLDALKDEVVCREADFVKNHYVGRLGRWAALVGGGFLAAYILNRIYLEWGVLFRYRSLLAMAAAACAGTWLSFSIRRVVLGFSDLANLEEDRLNPVGRLFFVVGLTSVVGLMLFAGVFDIHLGSSSLNAQIQTGLWATLVGVLCGISERALAGAVSQRSAGFVREIAEEARQQRAAMPPSGTYPS